MSTRLGNEIINKLQKRYPESIVTVNDVVDHDYPHLSLSHLAGYFAPIENLEQEHRWAAEASDGRWGVSTLPRSNGPSSHTRVPLVAVKNLGFNQCGDLSRRHGLHRGGALAAPSPMPSIPYFSLKTRVPMPGLVVHELSAGPADRGSSQSRGRAVPG